MSSLDLQNGCDRLQVVNATGKEERTASEPARGVTKLIWRGVGALLRKVNRFGSTIARFHEANGRHGRRLTVTAGVRKTGSNGSQLPVDLRAEGALLERRLPRVFLPPGLSTDANVLTGLLHQDGCRKSH